ncbi:unnamed protein product [Protopolystoma xenopodis]|uniref:Uncharacterized protein n=1 Tax=Protopolystoma xenopodis TaxID=117903 RepID=A0A3S5A9G1_9PLAT|nr:unnamed protein product [Protopolystoma xenopodis]
MMYKRMFAWTRLFFEIVGPSSLLYVLSRVKRQSATPVIKAPRMSACSDMNHIPA